LDSSWYCLSRRFRPGAPAARFEERFRPKRAFDIAMIITSYDDCGEAPGGASTPSGADQIMDA
jgi:hypothetical protein